MASASISTSSAGSMSRLTSIMEVAGRMLPNTSAPGQNEAAASAPGCSTTPSRRPHATATAP